MAFTLDHISNARLRGNVSSDKIGPSNAAFRCRWGRLEMHQVGVNCNHLRAQPGYPPYIDELKAGRTQHFRKVPPNGDIAGLSARTLQRA